MKNTLLSLFLLLACFGGKLMAQYTIPAESIRIRDPFVTVDRKNQKYYIVTTAQSEGHFALRAYESLDLNLWRDAGITYHGDQGIVGSAKPGTDSWWAPDTYLYKGRYYTIVTVSAQAENLLRCCTLLDGGKSPMGPYHDAFTLRKDFSLTPNGQQCLDGSLYVDDKGHPWLIYSLEWNGPDVKDHVGETHAVRLSSNLRKRKGEPVRLFSANEAPWAQRTGEAYVVDAPFLWKDKESGNLIMLWSSFRNGVYCVGQAISPSGRVEGPWQHLPEPIYVGGGHQMLFRDLQGNLRMSLHRDNNDAHLHIVPVTVRDGKVQPVQL